MTSSLRSSGSITHNRKRISSKAVFALAFYVVIPTFAILMMILTYPELSKERLFGILQRTIPIGLILILVSQYQVRFEKGDLGRLISNEIYVLFVVLWIFALLGGEPVIHQTWEEYHFSLHIWNYLVLILIVTGMNFIYYILEYKAYGTRDYVDDVHTIGAEIPTNNNGPKGVIITTLETQ